MIQSSGIVPYITPKLSARTEYDQEAASAAIGSYSKFLTKPFPATGKVIEGFHWDSNIWSQDSQDYNVTFIAPNWDATTSGIPTENFQPGVGFEDDLKVLALTSITSSGINENEVFNTWAPIIEHGHYYKYSQQNYLYSDDSVIQNIQESGFMTTSVLVGSGVSTIVMDYNPKPNIPISIMQYEWDSRSYSYIPIINARKVISFTGIMNNSNEREDTYNEKNETINWSLIDQSKPEFIIVQSGVYPQVDLNHISDESIYSGMYSRVILNKKYTDIVGSGTIPYSLETLGISDGTNNQQFHFKYAPIDTSYQTRIYSYPTLSGAITEWTTISPEYDLNGYQVKLDVDFGIVEFGSTNLPNQYVPTSGHTIGATYCKSLRLEYEPVDTDDSIVAFETNINPLNRYNSQGFIYLKTDSEMPASIVLEADLAELSTNVYGPLYLGNSYAPIIATVKDRNGNVLEDELVTFKILTSGVESGFGISNESTAFTNYLGKATVYYCGPKNIHEIGQSVTALSFSIENSPSESFLPGGLSQVSILSVSGLPITTNLDDIYLYEVHSDDPLLGYLDPGLPLDDSVAQLNSYYRGFFNEHKIWGPTGMEPPSDPPVEATVSGALSTYAMQFESDRRDTWNLLKPTIYSVNNGIGRKKIVAVNQLTHLDPHTFTAPAISLFQPVAVNVVSDLNTNIYYDTSTYSLPPPTVTAVIPSGTLHSYFVVSPFTAKFVAELTNKRTNQIIQSNEIDIKISIPPYANGKWIIDTINQNHIDEISILLSGMAVSNQVVPLGFRLKSSTITLASALDGITFLDVNEAYNYDQYLTYDDNIVISGLMTQSGFIGSGVYIGHKINIM